MEVFDVVFSHIIYQGVANSDRSLNELLEYVSPRINLSNENHRLALLKWLNKWGCRNISIASHHAYQTNIHIWWKKHGHSLCTKQKETRKGIAIIFDSLANIAVRQKRGNVKFGPTAAAKSLFIIDPDRYIPWDIEIRKKYGDTGKDYIKFLDDADRTIAEIKNDCLRKGKDWKLIKKKYCHSSQSDYKLLDEYYWIVRTNGIDFNREVIREICDI